MTLTGNRIGIPAPRQPLLTPEMLRDAVRHLEEQPYAPPIVILPPGTDPTQETP